MDSVNRWRSASIRLNGPTCISTQLSLQLVSFDITVLLEHSLLLSGKCNLVWPLRCMSNEHEFVINVSFQRLTAQPGFAILIPYTRYYRQPWIMCLIYNFIHLLTFYHDAVISSMNSIPYKSMYNYCLGSLLWINIMNEYPLWHL